ncbi:MAG TPA: glycosyltransferase family 39 protein [Acidimicrobiia bacterium]
MIPHTTAATHAAPADERPLARATPPPSTRAGGAAPAAWSRGELLVVVGITVGFAVAATWTLGRQSLTGDEAATWAISGHGVGDLLHVLGSSGGDRAAGLYYVALYAWTRVFGTSAAALRALSVGAAVATLPAFHAAARRLGRRIAFIADLLLAASPFFLTYARQARAYSLALLLVVLAAWAMLRALETDDARHWRLFIVVAGLALYTQWFSALVIAAFFVAAWMTSRPRLSRRAVAAAGVLLLVATPIIVLVLAGDTGGVGWIAPLSVAQLRDLASTLTSTHAVLGQLAIFGVAAVGLAAAARRVLRAVEGARSTAAAVAATWFVLPTALLVAVSLVKPLLVSHYLLVALPGLVLLVACGLDALARHRLSLMLVGVALVSALAWSAYGPLWAARHVDEDWSGIAQTVASRAVPGQAILVSPANAVYAFGYYARALAPLDHHVAPSWPPLHWDAPYFRDTPSAASVLARATTVRAPVVWFVLRDPRGPTISASTSNPAILRSLEAVLARRYRRREVVARFARRTASLVRYSDPSG